MIKSFDYYKLQTRLTKKADRKICPINAMFELTYRCNLRCRYCYVTDPSDLPQMITDKRMQMITPRQARGHLSASQEHSQMTDNNGRKELSSKEVFAILDQLASAGCLNLGFSGGEPFLRKDIFDILRYAKHKGFNIIILTNGTLITPKKADRLKALGLNKIDVSFHTTDINTFDWFTRVAGTYRKVLRSIGLLRQRGIDVYVKTTAMTINKDDMINIRHLAVEKFGAYFRWGPTVTPAWDGGKESLKFRLTPAEVDEITNNIQKDSEMEFDKLDALEKRNRIPKIRKSKPFKINHNRLFRCGAGKTDVVISPYGQMRLCQDILYPNYQILKGTFYEGWKELADYANNTSPGPNYRCKECELVKYCKSCPAQGWLECGDRSACPTYYKNMARLAKREAEKYSK